MFDFLIRKSVVKGAQKAIDKMVPKVNIHVPSDSPLPSIRELKKIASIVSVINGLEEDISKLIYSIVNSISLLKCKVSLYL